MKKILLFLLLSMCTINTYAQHDLYVYGIGTSYWVQKNDTAKQILNVNSPFFHIYKNIPILRPQLSLGLGVGVSSFNTILDDVIQIDTANGTGFTNYDIPGIKKYKFNTTYLEIPLEIQYQQNPNNHKRLFKIAAGIKGSYQISHHSKTKYLKSQSIRKSKSYSIPNINDFTYGPTLRIAYGSLGLYACYNLISVFNSEKAPEINQAFLALCFNIKARKNKNNLSPLFDIPFKLKPQESASNSIYQILPTTYH